MSFQQQNSTIQDNLFEDRRKNLCFEAALLQEGGIYADTPTINKVNKAYRKLLDYVKTEDLMMELEKWMFQNV